VRSPKRLRNLQSGIEKTFFGLLEVQGGKEMNFGRFDTFLLCFDVVGVVKLVEACCELVQRCVKRFDCRKIKANEF
jgi:hypothetical protein